MCLPENNDFWCVSAKGEEGVCQGWFAYAGGMETHSSGVLGQSLQGLLLQVSDCQIQLSTDTALASPYPLVSPPALVIFFPPVQMNGYQ